MNIVEAINGLPNVMAFKPAVESDIANIENRLNMKLAEEYKVYIKQFGAIIADGIELTGFSKAKGRDVVSVTKRECELNESINIPVYVIEDIGIEGVIIWQDTEGVVYDSSPNNGLKKIANSLTEYIINR